MEDGSVLIAGAGPAGLAVAGELARRGVASTLLEAGPAVGWAWHRHYPFLRLHTTRRQSALPALPFPRASDPYPTRDEMAAYLATYAEAIGADVRLDTPVRRIRRLADGEAAGRTAGVRWEMETADGRRFRARHAVVATGFNRLPVVPALPGAESFGGPLLHSSRWAELGEVAGCRVLVVGLGNSGADLVEELHRRGAVVAVAVRGPLHLVPLRLLGVHWRTWYRLAPEAAFSLSRLRLPTVRWAAGFWSYVQRLRFGDLLRPGLRMQSAAELAAHWRSRRAPLTAGPFVELLRRGEVEALPAVRAFHPGEAETADGERHPFDAVLLATGYRSGVAELLEPATRVALGLDEEGAGAEGAGEAGLPDGRPGPAPGLWFCGFLPELVRIGHAARRIGRFVAAEGGR